MARIKRKIKRQTSRAKIAKKPIWDIFSRIKFTESYTNLILGAIVVLITGILFISFAKGNRITQTSSTKDVVKTEEQNSNTSSTYTVSAGDNLWSISENVYKDGYGWVAIAKVNKIENPGLIYEGTKLMIPTIIPSSDKDKTVVQKNEQNLQSEDSVIQNNSITGNSYTVVSGDTLWDIAVRAYGDGFKWPEIAKANDLVNPSIIHAGNFFKIPR
ncbi:MAG: hypothetical protein HW400_772 [Candidatus Levybacteria bacterium]|nr:hypothetical protein [Candidatus Levybacteria bacterium]